jgi:anti-anti-sigma regulatory factor
MTITADAVRGAVVLTPDGVLDGSTYQALRDVIIKTALDEPAAIVVDVAWLAVPAESAWVVFTSARWHVGGWPQVPIVLVCSHRAVRSAITRSGVDRYVPVYSTLDEALDALASGDGTPARRRATTRLPASISSLALSREFVEEWLTAWRQPDMVATAKVVITILVENVLRHTDSAPGVRVESDGTLVTVAVSDNSHTPAAINESAASAELPCGLRIVDTLSQVWRSAPTPTGKTVWAVIGPENRL